MPYSKDKKFVFFHVPKNAGSTINRVLNNACNKTLIFPKMTYSIVDRYILEPCAIRLTNKFDENLKDYFKFAFVRNPYDRIVSGWKYAQKIAGIKTDFASFVKNLDSFRKYDTILWHTIISQTTHLKLASGEWGIDAYGKVENLDADLQLIASEFNLQIESIPKLNTTSHKHWSCYYTSELKDIVYNRFKKDFINFDYSR